MVKVLGLKNWY